MKSYTQRFSDLVWQAHEAAEHPEHWTVLLQDIATELEATKASMHIHSFDRHEWSTHTSGNRRYSFGYDDSATVAYASRYAVQDPYVQRIRERFPRRGIGTSEHLLTAPELRASEFYAEYGKPNGIFFAAWAVIEQNKRFGAGLAFVRPEDARPFTRRQLSLLEMLNPHLLQSFKHQRILTRTKIVSGALSSSTASFGHAVILLDNQRRPLYASKAAELMLRAQDGIRIRGKRLEAAHFTENSTFQEILDGASRRPWDTPHQPHRSTMRLTGRTGQCLQMVAHPVASSPESTGFIGEASAHVLVFLFDPSARSPTRRGVVPSLYKLSERESELADAILQRCTLQEAAERMGISAGTARLHLKAVMRKTGIHEQSKLMHLLLSLPGDPDHTRD